MSDNRIFITLSVVIFIYCVLKLCFNLFNNTNNTTQVDQNTHDKAPDGHHQNINL